MVSYKVIVTGQAEFRFRSILGAMGRLPLQAECNEVPIDENVKFVLEWFLDSLPMMGPQEISMDECHESHELSFGPPARPFLECTSSKLVCCRVAPVPDRVVLSDCRVAQLTGRVVCVPECLRGIPPSCAGVVGVEVYTNAAKKPRLEQSQGIWTGCWLA
eukprot:5025357-Amphidinium_carterae.1